MTQSRKTKRAKAAGRPSSPRGSESRPPAGRWSLVLPVLAAAALCAPLLLHADLPQGSDSFAITHYLAGFMESFRDGAIYPGWSPHTNLGLGGPAFVLFPPLFFYAAGAASWLAGGLVGGLKLYLVVVAALSAGSFYLLARDWAGPGLPAAAGAAVYTILPYHALDMYQRFAMPETTAFVFFPLILFFARRCLLERGTGAFAGLALSYAGLAYTHLVSLLSFSYLVGVWLLWEAARGRWKSLPRVLAALALGAALAAPVILPALLEKAYVNIDWVRQMPNGDFRINFLFKDEILPVLGFRDPIKPLVFRSAHAQLLLAAAAALAALGGRARLSPPKRHLAAVAAAGCGLCYLLQTRLSTPIWLLAPQLKTIQFPWRFQGFMVLTAALLVSFALSAPALRTRNAVAAILGVLVVPNLLFAAQNVYARPFNFGTAALAITAGDRGWVEPALTPLQFDRYRRFKYEKMDLPSNGFARGTGSITVKDWSASRRVLEVESAEGGTAVVATFWFPGWTGTIDGGPLRLFPSPRDGVISFEAPAGKHEVVIRFAMTPLRVWSFVLALAALGAIVPIGRL